METPIASRSRSTGTCLLKVPSLLSVKVADLEKVLLKIMTLSNANFPVFSILPFPLPQYRVSTVPLEIGL